MTEYEQYGQQNNQPVDQYDSRGVTSMICGIIGVALCSTVIGAIVLGIIALNFSKDVGSGMATAGKILGIIAIIAGAVFIVIWILYVAVIAAIIGGAGGIIFSYSY